MIFPSAAPAVAVAWMVCGLVHWQRKKRPRDVAFVEAATGRVVALASGAPALLGPLDIITDRTRVDLLAGSELRICHYLTARFLTVKGPARIMVSANGIKSKPGNRPTFPARNATLPKLRAVLRAAWWPGVSRSSFVRLGITNASGALCDRSHSRL